MAVIPSKMIRILTKSFSRGFRVSPIFLVAAFVSLLLPAHGIDEITAESLKKTEAKVQDFTRRRSETNRWRFTFSDSVNEDQENLAMSPSLPLIIEIEE